MTLATELIQVSSVQAGVSTFTRQQSIQKSLINQDHVVEFTTTGFTPQSLVVKVGDRVIWRNTTNATLRLHSGLPPKLFLPLLTTGVTSVRSANQETATSQPSEQEAFAAQLAPGAEFAHQFNIVGTVDYFNSQFNSENRQLTGTILVEEADDPSPTPDPLPDEDELDQSALGYATSNDRTLIRWFWTQPNQPTFRIYRQQGAPEQTLADVSPIMDEATAIAVLNTTDGRWPALWQQLQVDHGVTSIAELHTFLQENLFAAQQLANQYYPIALVLGWGYLDLDINTDEAATYRVEPLDGSPILGPMTIKPGQPTPLTAPTGLQALNLNPDSSTIVKPREGQWGVAQQNRRFHESVYLSWDSALDPDQKLEVFPAAWVVGYDIYRATSDAPNAFVQINGADAVQTMPDHKPDLATPSLAKVDAESDYALTEAYANDYEQIEFYFADDGVGVGHYLYRIAARDALGMVRSWPEDVHFFSDPQRATAHNFMPPPAPTVFAPTIDPAHTEVMITWQMTPSRPTQLPH
ncbi:hypothetical protein KFU94_10985 [Chloroflexi bacterium TSY]|nr:hypothetical protein [Chloroflexi bacterium TSY]